MNNELTDKVRNKVIDNLSNEQTDEWTTSRID